MQGSLQLLPDSAKPHLLGAVYSWCVEQGLTPHIVVLVDYPGVEVPAGYARDGKIVLNISPSATHGLVFEDPWIHFQARFGGVGRKINIPMAAVVAIYAAETQEGMGFAEPVIPREDIVQADAPSSVDKKPGLRVIK